MIHTFFVFDYSWIDEINTLDKHVLIVAEGILMFFTEQEVKELISKLATTFKGAEMLLDIIPHFMVEQIKEYDTKINMNLPRWGIKNGKELEKYNDKIEFVAEWNYFDYHKHRWEKMPSNLNLTISSQIVHIKFH